MTHYTPLQDYAGIITPSPLHFMQQHTSEFPEIDVQQHRLTIYGFVDRPLSFTVAELKQLPSVSRIHFLECHGNSSPASHGAPGNPNVGLPVQFMHGMTSCSEWTGVLLSVLLNEAGLQKEASWLVSEGGDACNFRTPFRRQRPWKTARGLRPEWRSVARGAGFPDPAGRARLGSALQREVFETCQGGGPALRGLE